MKLYVLTTAMFGVFLSVFTHKMLNIIHHQESVPAQCNTELICKSTHNNHTIYWMPANTTTIKHNVK